MTWRALALSACLAGSLAACGSDGPSAGPPAPPTVDQDTALSYEGHASGWTDCWQSFTAGRSGPLAAVRVWAPLPADVTLTLYEGEGTSGAVLATTTSWTDMGADLWEAALPDVPGTAGSKYTVRLTASSNLNWVIGTYTYGGGVSNVYGAGADFGITTYVR